jgi:hypothetical protein
MTFQFSPTTIRRQRQRIKKRPLPPPDPVEAVLLATFPVNPGDLETLAANRAKAVQTYILQTGEVEASRLFLKESQAADLRSDSSRVYLQFR